MEKSEAIALQKEFQSYFPLPRSIEEWSSDDHRIAGVHALAHELDPLMWAAVFPRSSNPANAIAMFGYVMARAGELKRAEEYFVIAEDRGADAVVINDLRAKAASCFVMTENGYKALPQSLGQPLS